jgi:hypothetical protein
VYRICTVTLSFLTINPPFPSYRLSSFFLSYHFLSMNPPLPFYQLHPSILSIPPVHSIDPTLTFYQPYIFLFINPALPIWRADRYLIGQAAVRQSAVGHLGGKLNCQKGIQPGRRLGSQFSQIAIQSVKQTISWSTSHI